MVLLEVSQGLVGGGNRGGGAEEDAIDARYLSAFDLRVFEDFPYSKAKAKSGILLAGGADWNLRR